MDEQQLADLVARLDRRLRRFPAVARCADCGIGHPLLLGRSRKQIVCQTCRLARQGRPPLEAHHLGGRPGDVTVEIPANLHALLSWLQGLWRGSLEPGSNAALLFDLVMLRAFGPFFGVEV